MYVCVCEMIWKDCISTKFFYLRNDLITPKFGNNFYICCCIHYALEFEATSKAMFLKFRLGYYFYSHNMYSYSDSIEFITKAWF